MNRRFKIATTVSVAGHLALFALAAWLPAARRTADASEPQLPVLLVFVAEDPTPSVALVEPEQKIVARSVPPPVKTEPVEETAPLVPSPPPEPVRPVEVVAPVVLATSAIASAPARTMEPTATAARPVTPSPIAPGVASAPAAPASEVVRVRGVAAYRKRHEPVYPLAARRRRQEGTVLLLVQLDAGGRVEDTTVRQSSGFTLLDDAARQAVRDWEFEAARLDAKPVPSEVEVPVRFELTR